MFRRIGEFLHDVVLQADWILFGLCTAATFYGILLIASATRFMDTNRYIITQGAGWFLGVILYFAFSSIDLVEVSKKWKPFLIFNVVFILLLLTPFGVEGGTGNRAWLDFPFLPVNIQPAEIVKVSFIILLARQLDYYRKRPGSLVRLSNVLFPVGHLLFMVLLIYGISSDAGSALVYVFVFLSMAFAAEMAYRWFAIGLGAVTLGAVAVWKFNLLPGYMRDRFLVVFDHTYQPLGKGWQQSRALLAVGSGRFAGQGLFSGLQTQSPYKSSLPARQTDFIFAVCGEELGFLGCLIIIALLLAIMFRCLIVARNAGTKMESYVCVGMAAMLLFQAAANIGMCLFILPVVGLTLPFFSYGGSSIVTLFAAMGIVSGIQKRSRPDWLIS